MTDETTSPADRMAVLYPNDVPQASQPSPVAETTTPVRESTLYPADQPGAQEPFTPHGAPVAYTLTPPEGLGFNKAILDEMTPVLRELNLSDAGANRLMPLAAKFHERILTGQADEYASMQTDWVKSVQNDPELGRGNFNESQRLAAVAVEAAGGIKGSPLVKFLEESGLGNHPEMVRAFKRLGEKLSKRG